MSYVILNPELGLYAATDVDWAPIGQTTCRFNTTGEAKKFMASCPQCWSPTDKVVAEPTAIIRYQDKRMLTICTIQGRTVWLQDEVSPIPDRVVDVEKFDWEQYLFTRYGVRGAAIKEVAQPRRNLRQDLIGLVGHNAN